MMPFDSTREGERTGSFKHSSSMKLNDLHAIEKLVMSFAQKNEKRLVRCKCVFLAKMGFRNLVCKFFGGVLFMCCDQSYPSCHVGFLCIVCSVIFFCL